MATIASNGTGGGVWSATASWNGGVVPVLGDKVNVVSPDVIENDGVVAAGDDTSTAISVKSGAVLKASRTVANTLSVRGDLYIETGGELDYGKSASVIPAAFPAKLRLNDSASLAIGKWGLRTQTGSSKIYFYGSTRTTNSYLTSAIAASGTSFDVFDVAGWAIGDVLVLGTTTTGSSPQTEERAITNIVGNTVTVAAITYAHQINGRVSNFTKSVVVEAFNSSFSTYMSLLSGSGGVGNWEIQHLSVRYSGTNAAGTKYGSISFYGNNGVTAGQLTSCGNITTYETGYFGFDFYAWNQRLTLDDCAMYQTGSGHGAYTRSNSVVTMNDCVSLKGANGLLTSWSQGGVACIFNRCWFIGNTTAGLHLQVGNDYVFNDCVLSSNFYDVALGFGNYIFNGGYLGYVNGSYDGSSSYNVRASLINSSGKFTAIDTNVNNVLGFKQNVVVPISPFTVILANKDINPAVQEIYGANGDLFRDNTTFKTGTASLRCEPLDADNPVTNTWQVFAPDGELVVVSGYVRKDTNYGSTNLPVLTLSGLGIVVSTYTMTDVDDTWQQFVVSGTQVTGTDGMLTLTVAFQSGAANAKAWIDGIVAPVSVAVNSGDLGYWALGVPSPVLLANFTSGQDVLNTLNTELTLNGSFGKFVIDNLDTPVSNSLDVGTFLALKDA